MIYVGIDIAKQKHFAAAMTADGEVLVPPFSFTNDAEGFNTFLSKIKSFDKSDTLIGLESTAHYGENLICFLFDRGYQISVINPIQTSTLRKTNIRKTKTDKVDCLLIIKSMNTRVLFFIILIIAKDPMTFLPGTLKLTPKPIPTLEVYPRSF